MPYPFFTPNFLDRVFLGMLGTASVLVSTVVCTLTVKVALVRSFVGSSPVPTDDVNCFDTSLLSINTSAADFPSTRSVKMPFFTIVIMIMDYAGNIVEHMHETN